MRSLGDQLYTKVVQIVTHPSTNQARHRISALIETNEAKHRRTWQMIASSSLMSVHTASDHLIH